MTPVVDISFIVPVYNAALYLRECVDSILTQADYHGTLEVLLVEDGSTDGSAGICHEYARRHPGVRVIERGHGGVSHARNSGIEEARGRYIAFVDADDTVLPHYAAAMTRAIEDSDIACCGYFRRPRVSRPGHSPGDRLRRYTAHDAVMWMLYQRHGIDCSPWGKLYRREVIGGERFVEGRRYEDLEWTPRVALRAARGVTVLNKAYYYYRVTPGSFINTVNRSRLDVLDMVGRVRQTVARTGDARLMHAVRERTFSANYNMFILLGDDREVADRCWAVMRRERRHTLFGRRVRMKSRLGALLTYAGRGILGRIAAMMRRHCR